MMVTIVQIFKRFSTAVNNNDSLSLAGLFDLRACLGGKSNTNNDPLYTIDMIAAVEDLLKSIKFDVDSFNGKCRSMASSVELDNRFEDSCAAHVTVVAILVKISESSYGSQQTELWGQAINAQFFILETMLQLYIDFDHKNEWLMQSLKVIMHHTRILAGNADKACDPVKRGFLTECKVKLDNVFRPFVKKKDPSKKMVLLSVVINSIKVLFALQTINLSRNLIKQVDHAGFPKMDLFPISEQRTYFYYVGRLLTYEDKLEDARSYFERALDCCSQENKNQIEAIMEYLVPINLFFGRRPAQELLVKYQCEHFQELVDLMRKGNVRALEDWIEERQDMLVQCGLLLSLESLKILAYRNLFRNVVAIRELKPGEKATQIPLQYLIGPFSKFGERDPMATFFNADEASTESKLEQLHCVLGILVHKRLLRGYISHEKQIMVIAPRLESAFPPIKNEQWW